MNSIPSDQGARDRFTTEWAVNFAVVASAGSGKTTAISERLAALAISPEGADALAHTAVVTYTKKAAAQIQQRARSVLLRRMSEGEGADVEPLARLERAFFGTIHSFCLLLARRHGSTLGIHLNPVLAEAGEESHWQEFVEQDPMTFGSLSAAQVATFLRHESLDEIFELAADLDLSTARRLLSSPPPGEPPPPPAAALELLMGASARKGKASEALARNKAAAAEWVRQLRAGTGRLPIPVAEGRAAGVRELFVQLFAPLKGWLAEAGGVLAAELSLRYRTWRLERGIQTYSDQLESALAVLDDASMLERIRAEGWRVILDEAQDTDPKQFEVLVEIARPPGARRSTWPSGGGAGPRPGHFCMVGDSQQGIYSDRADIRNFTRHVDAFGARDGGERLTFDVTFRAPRQVIRLLNATLPAAFGEGRLHNVGVPPDDGAPAPFLQVGYKPLVPGPANIEGTARRLPIAPAAITGRRRVGDKRLADEARQIALLLRSGGPAAVGARSLGDICLLAPRNPWLQVVRNEFDRAGVKTALQMRRNRNGDNPVYAWLSGLLAVVCDPDNGFEWVGVLREVFAVSDAVIAGALRGGAPRWDEPGDYPEPVASALRVVGGFISRADLEGESLGRFAAELAAECGLGEKARILDPEGGLADELARLVARASDLGAEGGGPRAWLGDLLGSLDEFRAWGRPASDAVNILTAHSAKGLEWPVVIPVGLWREIGTMPNHGLRLVREGDSAPRVVLDNDGLSADTRDSLERARLRELVRLLYVTLTRAKSALVIPWAEGAPDKNSFAWLWGVEPGAIEPVQPVPRETLPPGDAASVEGTASAEAPEAPPAASPAPPLPKRVLPHQLAGGPDLARSALHESSVDTPASVRDSAIDPLDYGVWWHETLEFVPWDGDPAAVAAHGEASLAKAAAIGFEARGREEWERFLGSGPWRQMREKRWTRLAEAGIFAPLAPEEWIDGVIDLVLHDPVANEVWIVDWKTNRRVPGEGDEALLGRLCAEYEGQLSAYGRSASGFFKACRMRLWVYSTVAGLWAGVGEPS
jgi:ATP-dependent helicase/nuclease subunit A